MRGGYYYEEPSRLTFRISINTFQLMRTSTPALMPIFRSELQLRLIALLLEHERESTAAELASMLAAAPPSLHRELHRLLDAGLIKRRAVGRTQLYSGAPDSPVYAALRELTERTVGVEPPAGVGRWKSFRTSSWHSFTALGRAAASVPIAMSTSSSSVTFALPRTTNDACTVSVGVSADASMRSCSVETSSLNGLTKGIASFVERWGVQTSRIVGTPNGLHA